MVDRVDLPAKDIKPNPYMDRNPDGSFVHPMNGKEKDELEMDNCKDCICPITCQSFKRCIYQEDLDAL